MIFIKLMFSWITAILAIIAGLRITYEHFYRNN